MLTLNDLHNIYQAYESDWDARVESFSVGNQYFDFNCTQAMMGVINLSSDSWYRESVCVSSEQAIRRALTLQAQGAHLIDIGAESTLPQAQLASGEQQQNQLLPLLATLHQHNVATSVETYHPEVAKACLQAGAAVINLTGSEDSAAIYQQVAAHDAGVIICFVQGKNVRDVDAIELGADPVQVMYDYFARQIETATKAGVRKIFIDAGLGFYYKNLQDSNERIRYQMRTFLTGFRLRRLGFPVCQALPHAFEHFGEEVRTAESFFAVLATLGKTDLVRTHEVAKVKAVLDTLHAY
ncbi:MAG: dihydropteroate synthase [Pseudomonadota bacterium]